MTFEFNIQMDKKCSSCGKPGAIEENPSGLCMKCIGKGIERRIASRFPKTSQPKTEATNP